MKDGHTRKKQTATNVKKASGQKISKVANRSSQAVTKTKGAPVKSKGQAAARPSPSVPKGSAIKGPPVKGPATKGPATKGSAIKGPAVKGPAVKGPAVKGSAVKSPAVKGFPVKGAGNKSSASKGAAVKGSAGNSAADAKGRGKVIPTGFTNPLVGVGFKRAVKKYPNALKRLTD